MAFSPGRLIATRATRPAAGGFQSHAEFEQECWRCHQPLQTTQDVLCLECHTGIRTQLETGEGTHDMIEGVNRCAKCHPDHRGRDFDSIGASFSYFDHSRTPFSLVWHQLDYQARPIQCEACHERQVGFAGAGKGCADCHAQESPGFVQEHRADFGERCTGCHDGVDSLARFDHAQTDFVLAGRHAETRCAACHNPRITGAPGSLALFGDTPRDCLSCHTEPLAHQGLFGVDCASCHTAQAWTPAKWADQPFNHFETAGFSLIRHALDYDGQPLVCTGCHSPDMEEMDLERCTACHSSGEERAGFMQRHQAQFGADCLVCHDGVDRLSEFNHNSFFVLDGAHGEIDCESCHASQVYRGTASDCATCHAEPEIHAGFFGLQCEYCHTSQAWTPATLRHHVFPLDHGGQGEIACQGCHVDRYVEYTCYGCHDHQPARIQASHLKEGVSLAELANCAQCHPTGREDEP